MFPTEIEFTVVNEVNTQVPEAIECFQWQAIVSEKKEGRGLFAAIKKNPATFVFWVFISSFHRLQ